MDEKRETNTPNPKVMAKPRISEVPNQKRMAAVIKLEKFESRMENQARLKPEDRASSGAWPAASSSFRRAKISTLASTAMPRETMKPATPAAVKTIGINLKSISTSVAYTHNAKTARSPGKRYHSIRKIATAAKPKSAALMPSATARSPKAAPMVWVEINSIFTGKAPKFKLRTS